MKIYIEKDGEFYHHNRWPVETTYNYACDDTTKTDKRDFEIGARVYFEGVGWTEVINEDIYDMCHECVFLNDDSCTGRKCNYLGREDGESIIYRQLTEEKSIDNKNIFTFEFDKTYLIDGIEYYLNSSMRTSDGLTLCFESAK